jgi:hypothetical protein
MEFGIDFDESSREWRKNKKSKPNGYFEYTCNYTHSTGKQCRRSLVSSKLMNYYECGFGGYTVNKYKNHPNRNYFCKRHIHRYCEQ